MSLSQDPFASCLKKQEALKALFHTAPTPTAKYEKLIAMGKNLPPLAPQYFLPENLVPGCQSIFYLRTYLLEGKMHFEGHSEALISSGLAALLFFIYNEEPPLTLLKCPPTSLETLGIQASLTPGRSNGLASMYLRMQQEALKFLTQMP